MECPKWESIVSAVGVRPEIVPHSTQEISVTGLLVDGAGASASASAKANAIYLNGSLIMCDANEPWLVWSSAGFFTICIDSHTVAYYSEDPEEFNTIRNIMTRTTTKGTLFIFSQSTVTVSMVFVPQKFQASVGLQRIMHRGIEFRIGRLPVLHFYGENDENNAKFFYLLWTRVCNFLFVSNHN